MFTALISLLIISCNQPPQTEPGKPVTPKALEEKSSEISVSGRGNGDILESLYKEIVDKDPDLKELENQVAGLNDHKEDSVEVFNNYKNRNDLYYSTAIAVGGTVKDSVIREKIKTMLTNSRENFTAGMSTPDNLVTRLRNKEISLADMHTLLKITKTLKVIEQYQKDNLPSGKPIESVIKELDQVTRKAETLSKQ